MKPKVPSVVQGQMSREKFCSFGTCCVKPSLIFFFSPTSYKKKSHFLVSIPQKETTVPLELSPHLRNKKDKIFWEVFDPLQVGMAEAAGKQRRAQCSKAYGAISECVVHLIIQ